MNRRVVLIALLAVAMIGAVVLHRAAAPNAPHHPNGVNGYLGALYETTDIGPEVTVPSAKPLYVQDAEAKLQALGLGSVIFAIPPITDADAGVNGYSVTGQDPAPGKRVPAGSTVVLALGITGNGGPGGVGKPGIVPDLVGMHVNLAISAATAAGLHVTVGATTHPVSSDAVSRQSLSPGTQVAPDDVITLTVG